MRAGETAAGTTGAAGTVQTAALRVRPATEGDLPLLEGCVRYWSERQVLLPLLGAELRAALPDFRILSPAGRDEVLAFGALRRYSARLAEIRSLVVQEGARGRGLGRSLVTHLLDEARTQGLSRVFVLTRAPGVFERLGFTPVPRETLPEKVYLDCSLCARRDRCDELALVREIR
jgi:N-acetylglutamate synthase-like GNAT family acetyltransferase